VNAPAQPGVDVVVPCYNGARYLAQTLDAALAQTYRPLRILVVDDGSTDGTRRLVETYRGRLDYVHKENGGQASARNLGIARTHGQYVWLLDADDLPAPEMVARLVGRLEARPEADFAHAPPLAFFGDDRAHPAAEHWRPAVAWGSYLEPLSILCAIHASATVFRRRAFERFGAFPESRALQGCEDWHFWLDATVQGALVERVAEPLCLYRKHLASSSASKAAIARRETELMKAAVGLFDRHGLRDDPRRAVLSVGIASVAARWLALDQRPGFESLLALAAEVAPPEFRVRHLDSLRARTGAPDMPLVQVALANALLDLDLHILASVVFLRCRTYRALRAAAARHGQTGALERVAQAAAGIVAGEAAAAGRAAWPSYATHLAVALATLEASAAPSSRARDYLERALLLDPGNVVARLEVARADLKEGRVGGALSAARALAERRRAFVAGDVGRWVATRLRTAVRPGASR
jgi:GT2 family glycosyltransferase